jgi:hypothetical protein
LIVFVSFVAFCKVFFAGVSRELILAMQAGVIRELLTMVRL